MKTNQKVPSCSMWMDRWADRQVVLTELVVVFRNFVNMLKKDC